MAARKRKSPDKRRPANKPGLASSTLAAAGGFFARNIGRHPKPVLGGAGFVVLFSFVAANALWYQSGDHPAPFLATRDPENPDAIAGYRPVRRTLPDDVTTFRIERAHDKPATPAAALPSAPSANTRVPPQLAGQPEQLAPPAEDAGHALVADVQRQLSRRGLYDGTDDGVTGPRTQSAILFFQETAGLPRTGEATAELLAVLKAEPQPSTVAGSHPAPAPLPRPAQVEAARSPLRPALAATPPPTRPPAANRPVESRPVETVSVRGEDPVATAIRASEHRPGMTPPADIPNTGWKPGSRTTPAKSTVPSSDLVLQIQRGLSNIAYADVEVDGVAGSQTKEAIRRFQKHYRLPETGEPDPVVLNKLKSIGAL